MYAAGITYTGVSSVSPGGPGPGGQNAVISFDVGDGQPGSPVNGQTTLIAATLQGQSLVNVQLLVIREGIELRWNSTVTVKDIRRFNSGGLGGFSFEVSSGLAFFVGEHYDIYILSINNMIQV